MLKKINTFAFLMLIVCFLASGCKTSIRVEDINKQRAELIIHALYEYKGDYGSFPEGLNVLMPDYLDSIPKDFYGGDFSYSKDKVSGFNLAFPVDRNHGCGFSDVDQKWECGYGD